MAGEAINVVSNWFLAISSSGPATGGMDTGTPRTPASGAAISLNEQAYPLHDFQLVVSSGTPLENRSIDLYRIPNGNAAGRTPTPSYLQQYVGSFVMDNATGSYYIYGVVAGDPGDTYITYNDSGATVTYLVNQRTKTTGPAA